jgi:hypothetical protein
MLRSIRLTGGRGPAHLPGQPRSAPLVLLWASRSGRGTNGPSATGPRSKNTSQARCRSAGVYGAQETVPYRLLFQPGSEDSVTVI